MSDSVFELETGKLRSSQVSKLAVELSVAVSLKRIADSLDAVCSHGDRVESHLSNIADQLLLART